MKYNILDTIVLTENILGNNLTVGMIGVIIEVYSEPVTAYEVEFCDEYGQTICTQVLYENQVTLFE